MAAQPAPETWIANRRLLSSELNQSVRNWARASSLGIATTYGQMPYALGTRELAMVDPPTAQSVLKHSGALNSAPYWGNPGIRDQNDAVQHSHIADDAVHTANIEDEAVTTPKLATAAVTNPKLGERSVGESKLADDAVTSPKVANEAIDRMHLSTSTRHVSHGETSTNGIAGALLIRMGTIPAATTANPVGTRAVFTGSYQFPTYGWFVVTYKNTQTHATRIFSTWTIPAALGFDHEYEFNETSSAHGYICVVREAVRDSSLLGTSTQDRISVITVWNTQRVDYTLYWYEGIPGIGTPA